MNYYDLPLTNNDARVYLLGLLISAVSIFGIYLYKGRTIGDSLLITCVGSVIGAMLTILLMFSIEPKRENIGENYYYSSQGKIIEKVKREITVEVQVQKSLDPKISVEKYENRIKTVEHTNTIATVSCPMWDSYFQCLSRVKGIDISSLGNAKEEKIVFNLDK